MKLSVVIPAYNEEQNITPTVESLYSKLKGENIPHEIRVVNDNSKDNTQQVLDTLKSSVPTLVSIFNSPPSNGFGFAVRKGLETFEGDCVAVFMADMSDSPDDLVKFYRVLVEENLDCVFGTRFSKGGKTYDYPKAKLILNRFVNFCVRMTFDRKYNDFTNAFKLYKRDTMDGLKPFLSPHFNLTLELPLKAIVRGYSYSIVPNSWTNRQFGTSNLKIQEMGSRYFFIFLYCLIERFFSKQDFHKSSDKK